MDAQNNPKRFQPYNKAKADLLDRLGEYCSYCERPGDLHVEHVVPKNIDKTCRKTGRICSSPVVTATVSNAVTTFRDKATSGRTKTTRKPPSHTSQRELFECGKTSPPGSEQRRKNFSISSDLTEFQRKIPLPGTGDGQNGELHGVKPC